MEKTIKKNRKQIIFEEAARLFQEKGYRAASMRDLADRVGLERASSLYSHIKSKEEILLKICMENAHRFVEGLREVEAKPGKASDKILQLIQLHIRIAIEDSTSVTVFNDEWRYLSEPHLSDFLGLRREYEQGFLRLIESGIESEELKALDGKTILYTLISSTRWIHNWYRAGREIDQEALQHDIASLLLNGLRKDKWERNATLGAQ